MKLIIPMAGRGTRLRPHTLITPKPLLKVCGKYILEVIIKTLVKAAKNKITEVVFDRNGNPYHGRVKAVADAAREAGLKF